MFGIQDRYERGSIGKRERQKSNDNEQENVFKDFGGNQSALRRMIRSCLSQTAPGIKS